MMKYRQIFIATLLGALLSFQATSQAPVVDDSDNYALLEKQQLALNNQVMNPSIGEGENENDMNDAPALAIDESETMNNTDGASLTDNSMLLERLQHLQEEMRELRGQLEVQAHDLKLLQQQQLAYYKDLDARLHDDASKRTDNQGKTQISITANPQLQKSSPTEAMTSKIHGEQVATTNNPAEEQISYLAAYELVKSNQYDEAMKAFKIFIQQYPSGGYAANAHYWLGELYMVQQDYTKALVQFKKVLEAYPNSSKAAACQLKMGYAFAAMGQLSEAKAQLNQVVKYYPDTKTAKLANDKLRTLDV